MSLYVFNSCSLLSAHCGKVRVTRKVLALASGFTPGKHNIDWTKTLLGRPFEVWYSMLGYEPLMGGYRRGVTTFRRSFHAHWLVIISLKKREPLFIGYRPPLSLMTKEHTPDKNLDYWEGRYTKTIIIIFTCRPRPSTKPGTP